MLQLTPRERWSALAGIVLLALGAFYGFLVKPISERTQRLYEIVPQKHEELERLKTQGQQYRQLTNRVQELQNKLPDTNTEIAPLPHLESLLDVHDLKQRVTTMNQEPSVQEGRYSLTVVQIRMEGVAMASLLRFLQDIKNDDIPLHVQTMQLSRSPESPEKLNAALTLNSVAVPSAAPTN